MRVSYHKLEPPYPPDFLKWYPYAREENLPLDVPWGPWLRRLVSGDTAGVHNCFFAARDDRTRRWIGVVWCAVSPATPELAHLGWFWVEDEYRGQGVGRQLMQEYLSEVETRGVEMVMLPTQVSNKRAVGMYERRGWEITLAQPDDSTRCWMAREPEFGYQSRYFDYRGGRLEIAPPEPLDYVGLDYLLCRPLSESRLLPDFAGRRRFCSFVVDWQAEQYAVARVEGRPLGLGVLYERGGFIDAFALNEEVLSELLWMLAKARPQAQAFLADSDELKHRVLRELGFRPREAHELELPEEKIRLRRYAR